ncbi:MAG TPA: hypothetical protein IAB68_04360 [Candidatus Aphodocola excrementigallinarum]|uniref:Uncharacterized protein n=1 Tax=Candidatus Aphodocola excrementigallinarum TaxID=2840670 RepID=A0A9D1IRA6_9FIRM|nr:hypothetical protein [Candidatus Aphodocola excrementigallinarum]
MNLDEQFRVIFYSFIYGMFFLFTFKLFRLIKIKKLFYKFVLELIFFMLHVTLFYFLLYKINGGMLSSYIIIFLILGCISCHLLYFNDKKD